MSRMLRSFQDQAGESKCKKGFEEPGESSLMFEAPLQGNFAVERLGSPRAPKKQGEGQSLTFGMKTVSKYLTEPFPDGRHWKS